jgi:hypothetical protein
MRTFVRFDRDGTILETARVELLPKGKKHPYAEVPRGESVLEVDPSEGVEELAPHEIQTTMTVDTKKKRLMARKGTKKASATRRTAKSRKKQAGKRSTGRRARSSN